MDLSPWPSPVSPPLMLSDSEDDDGGNYGQGDALGPSISRPGSPMSSSMMNVEALPPGDDEDVVTCRWEDCGQVFVHLPTLINHIHNDHIGVQKSNYTCEWATCSRRGLPQTSRFALTSHIRSHTGEKPFTCPRPECDKSFTRSDALAKHMRLQHNISPPLPGRGGSRKRKRNNRSPSVETNHTTNSNSFNTFRVDTQNANDSNTVGGEESLLLQPTNGQPGSPTNPSVTVNDSDGEDGAVHDGPDDALPDYVLQHADPHTGLIFKRSPMMVRYLLEKAKHQYALQEHEALLEELRTLRKVLLWERKQKEMNLDEVLKMEFGDDALALTEKSHPPAGYRASDTTIKAIWEDRNYGGVSKIFPLVPSPTP